MSGRIAMMPPAADEATAPRIDVEGLHASRRRRAWIDTLYEYYYPLDASLPDGFRCGRLAVADVGIVRIGRVESDAMVVDRSGAHVGKGVHDFYFLPLPEEGPLALHQRGRSGAFGPQEFAFVGTAEAYSYDQPGTNKSHTLRIPGPALRARIRNVDDWTARTFSARSPMTRVFLDFARSFCRNGLNAQAEVDPRLIDPLLDLLALVVSSADQGTQESAVRVAHRQRALNLIETRFRDNALDAAAIAAALGLSERYLQKIFAERNETISAIIRSRRIAEACRMLANRDTSRASVSSIAYAVGFTDPAHFSRVFRRETGVVPVHYTGR